MARTPLFALLQRAARIARNAARVDMPLDEFHARGRELRIDATRPVAEVVGRLLEWVDF